MYIKSTVSLSKCVKRRAKGGWREIVTVLICCRKTRWNIELILPSHKWKEECTQWKSVDNKINESTKGRISYCSFYWLKIRYYYEFIKPHIICLFIEIIRINFMSSGTGFSVIGRYILSSRTLLILFRVYSESHSSKLISLRLNSNQQFIILRRCLYFLLFHWLYFLLLLIRTACASAIAVYWVRAL